MKKLLALFTLTTLCLTNAFAVITIVESWQFDTPGDTEDWIVNLGADFDVRPAISGTETVLSGATTSNDPQLRYDAEITTPEGFQNWETLTIRWRQLDGNPTAVETAARTYSNGGTRIEWPGSGFKQPLPIASAGDWTFTFEPSGEWVESTWDISDSSETSIAARGWRFDPIGDEAGLGYEVDYIEITAAIIPEPSTYAVLIGLATLGVVAWQRRRR